MEKTRRRKLDVKKMAVRMLFLSVVLYAGYTLISQQISMAQREKTVEECETMISDAKGETARLEEELGLVSTDEYKEQKAREMLDYVRPDERIYIDVTK